VACPYFVPREIVHNLSWPHPARLPLGAGWTGTCSAAGEPTSTDRAIPVDDNSIRDFCNLGYATACPRLPSSRDWDAIRFSVANSTPEQITLLYVCERDHAPMAHGTMTYDLATSVWRDPHPDARVLRLATSYVHSYRVRQSRSLI